MGGQGEAWGGRGVEGGKGWKGEGAEEGAWGTAARRWGVGGQGEAWGGRGVGGGKGSRQRKGLGGKQQEGEGEGKQGRGPKGGASGPAARCCSPGCLPFLPLPPPLPPPAPPAPAQVPACLPLPLYLLWAHLLLVASRLRLWLHARRAASVLLPHFVHTSPDRPLWEASPMDAQRLERRHVDVAARPLLRAFVQVRGAGEGA